MSTIAPVEESLDLTFLEELGDDKVECFWHDCGAEATWRARWQCGHSITYCDQHYAFLSDESHSVKHCGRVVSPGLWSPL